MIYGLTLYFTTAGEGKVRSSELLDFRVAPEKLTYVKDSIINLRFTIMNVGNKSIYVHRQLNACSQAEGYIELAILDSNNQNVRTRGCTAEFSRSLVEDSDPTAEISKPEFWILLRPNEIYGNQQQFEAPKRKGIYRIKAALTPPSVFTPKQRAILEQNEMLIISDPHAAPVATIRVD